MRNPFARKKYLQYFIVKVDLKDYDEKIEGDFYTAPWLLNVYHGFYSDTAPINQITEDVFKELNVGEFISAFETTGNSAEKSPFAHYIKNKTPLFDDIIIKTAVLVPKDRIRMIRLYRVSNKDARAFEGLYDGFLVGRPYP